MFENNVVTLENILSKIKFGDMVFIPYDLKLSSEYPLSKHSGHKMCDTNLHKLVDLLIKNNIPFYIYVNLDLFHYTGKFLVRSTSHTKKYYLTDIDKQNIKLFNLMAII